MQLSVYAAGLDLFTGHPGEMMPHLLGNRAVVCGSLASIFRKQVYRSPCQMRCGHG